MCAHISWYYVMSARVLLTNIYDNKAENLLSTKILYILTKVSGNGQMERMVPGRQIR